MPFDSLEIDNPQLRVATLVQALRGDMPPGFMWDFTQVWKQKRCGSVGCALGLASLIWPQHAQMLRMQASGGDPYKKIADFFGMSERDVGCVFFAHCGTYHAQRPRATTVANELEKVLYKNKA